MEIVKFDNNELEMIMITYNRVSFVNEWLDRCYMEICNRNIKFRIIDSSTNDETKKLIGKKNSALENRFIPYEYMDSNYSVGYVVLNAILSSKSKYVWIVGDSRCHNFEILDKKVFHYLKGDVDHVVLHIVDNGFNDGKIYSDKNEMLKDCLISMTCTGLYIYKTSIFQELMKHKKIYNNCLQKYKCNYGFTWMGFFLEGYALKDYKTVFTVVPIIEILPQKKIQRWNTYFYKCWCEDLLNVIDGISYAYNIKRNIIGKTWRILGFNSSDGLLKNCRDGVLDVTVFRKYKDELLLFLDSVDIIEEFANSDETGVDAIYEYWHKQEIKEFLNKCRLVIDKLDKTKRICIYGAGRGGKALANILQENGITIWCFYDKKYEEIKELCGITVRSIEESDSTKEYMLIGFIGNYVPVESYLSNYGFCCENCCYIKFDM